ncbi:LOW QUALITY PROTEIN: monooxygenase 3 [Cryptomeria japonica]|uniref:LOW QUALITY PROTEIN: monooxygenase 3 n=1 Tax=Cryptomeria japonica TaxID=3369 RepID=UPI0027DA333E|nr:LOW QUALITY PROTEIN: monooxygenase 3 [Cryptomeria japonica]
METELEGFVVTGAGIAGLATALALHRVGIKSIVMEKAESLRATVGGIGIWTNAWKALTVLGIADHLREQHPFNYRVIHQKISSLYPHINRKNDSQKKSLICSFDLITLDGGGMIRNFSLQASDSGHKFRCVKRAALLEALATALPPETIKFNSRVLRVRQSLSSKYSSETEPEDGTVIRAKLRQNITRSSKKQKKNHPPEIIKFNSKFLGAAISELQIFVGNGAGRRNRNQSKGGDWLRWSEVGGSIGVSRVSDSRQCRALRGSGNGDLHRRSRCPTKSSDSLLQWNYSEIAQDPSRIHEFTRSLLHHFPSQITEAVNLTVKDSLNMTVLRFRWPWNILTTRACKGSVTAAGDAVHPMTPDLAQGGCCALEDAIVLARCLAESLNGRNNTDNEGQIVEEALKTYVDERKWRWVWLVSQVYITGLVQQSSSDFLRFIRDKVVLKFMSPKDMFIQYLL